MNTKELSSLLKYTVPAGLPTLTLGSPGLGKSSIHKQIATEMDWDYQVIYPTILDPVDLGGLPVPTNGHVIRMLDNDMLSLFDDKKPTLLLIDEIGQSSPAMQAACAPLILEHTLGGKKLPKTLTICAAGNRAKDRAGSSPILTHIISRMSTVVTLEADAESWCSWATKNRISPHIISYIRFRPKMINNFDAIKSFESSSAYPCPRSWHNLSKLLNAGIDDMESLSGCVGEGVTHEFLTHRKLCLSQLSAEEVLSDVKKWKFPKDIGSRYAIVSSLAAWVKESTLNSLIHIAEKLMIETPEYSVLLMRDVLDAHREFSTHPLIIEATAGPLGKMIMEI